MHIDVTPDITLDAICLRVSIAVKRHHDHGNSYKGKHLIEVVAYSFRGLIHYHRGGGHGGELCSVQTDMVLELRLLHLEGNRKSTETPGSILSIGNLKAHLHSDTLLPTKPHLLKVPSL